MGADIVLEMKDIIKTFPGVKALDGAQLVLHKGTVHALVGENGAGKSTLMKCLYGIYHKDGGTILLDGQEVNFANSREAIDAGVSMIPQELETIPMMTIAENMSLGRYPMKGHFIDDEKMNAEAVQYIRRVGLNVPPTTLIANLTIAQQQSVEIAKAISHHAKVIIMDEPTSSLTDNEVAKLFDIIHALTAEGISIVYISHKMDEIFEIADEITVMRDGQWVVTYQSREVERAQIIADMVGRSLTNQFPEHENHSQKDIELEVRNFSSPDRMSFQNCSFQVHRGEVLGVAGLVGAQRSELMEAVFGLRAVQEGAEIYKEGKKINIRKPEDAIKNGLALVTEDRRGSGIFGVLPVSDNITIASIHQFVEQFGLLNHHRMQEVIEEVDQSLQIKTPSYQTPIVNLSGGNQQKVILARWLATQPDIYILDEPTRGIDVGAKYEIYEIIDNLSKVGKTVIMISSELPEILGITDRIMVMSEGRITGYLNTPEASQESVMELATQNINNSQVKGKVEA